MTGQVKKEIVVKSKSLKTFGIIDDQEQWWNITANTVPTEEQKTKLRGLNKGDKITLTISDATSREYSDFEVTEQASVGQSSSSFDEDFVSFKDLLKQAHEKFGDKLSISTTMLQISMTEPIFKAQVSVTKKLKNGNLRVRTFNGHGDATTENTTSMTQQHLVRMAETRAISRALRFLLGETRATKEELGDPARDEHGTMPAAVVDAENLGGE